MSKNDISRFKLIFKMGIEMDFWNMQLVQGVLFTPKHVVGGGRGVPFQFAQDF